MMVEHGARAGFDQRQPEFLLHERRGPDDVGVVDHHDRREPDRQQHRRWGAEQHPKGFDRSDLHRRRISTALEGADRSRKINTNPSTSPHLPKT